MRRLGFAAVLCAVWGTVWSPAWGAAQSAGAAAAVQPRIILQLGHAAPISAAAFTPDGRFLITGSSDRQLLVWDLAGRVVNRAPLPGGDHRGRAVVRRIKLSPDGRGAAIEQLLFRDVWDNGSESSEVWLQSYAYRMGEAAATVTEETQQPPPWRDGVSFYAGSTAVKAGLIGRQDWPRSALGWTLAARGGRLALIPLDPAAAAVPLAGARGPDLDADDQLAEATARAWDAATRAMSAGRPSKKDDEGAFGAASPGGPPTARLAAPGPGPLTISPDGRLAAWLDRPGPQARSAVVRLLDLDRGAFPDPVALAATAADDRLEWTGGRSLAVISASGAAPARLVDLARSTVRTMDSGACPPTAIGDRGALTWKSGGSACPAAAGFPTGADRTRRARLSASRRGVDVSDLATGAPLCVAGLEMEAATATAVLSPDSRVLALQSPTGLTQLFSMDAAFKGPAATGPRAGPCRGIGQPFAAPLGGIGFHPTRPVFWSQGRSHTVIFYPMVAGRPSFASLETFDARAPSVDAGALFTLYLLPDAHFFAVDPQGRYDTNLPPFTRDIRWLMADAPLQSLAPQTFMRDYYQPGLMRALLACSGSVSARCHPPFPPARPVAELNRTLPLTRITAVRPGPQPGFASVEVEVAEGIDAGAANGKTRSGIYDLRLFRDDRLVARAPGRPETAGDLAAWRAESRLAPDGDGRTARLTFTVAVATGEAAGPAVFTAYAFNEDRVKGETATLTYARPPGPRRAPHAYVIAVGVDAAAEPAWNLHFAAADARAMATGLAAIPGYAVTAVSLVSTPQSRIASKANLRALLQLLTDGDAAARRRLDEAGLSTAGLNAVTPDDLVIISFSGHGWTDGAGAFYLVPGDGRRRPGTEDPDPASLVSSGELSEWLRGVDAGEMALIIDACHSAASVDAAGFKPGPMGDPGLGQLAYDKGIRVLAAAQADDVAQEDAGLRQGLLTYALVHDGLSGAAVDLRLDQWLRFGAERLPGLSRERQAAAAAGRSQSSSGIEVDDDGSAVQQPQLFDFTGRPSPVTLRRAGASVPAGQGAQ